MIKFFKIKFMKQFNQSDEIKPDNILIKLSWSKQLEFLSIEEKGIVLTNIYNYHLGEELLEMTIPAKMFFANAIEVFEYNQDKYSKVVLHNREVGKKGGRPKQNVNQLDITKTQKNPLGLLNNPNNPKDKGIDREKDRIIDIDKTIDKVEDIVIPRNKNKEIDKLTRFKKLMELDNIRELDDKNFISYVKILSEKIGWDKFNELILVAAFNNVPDLIIEFQLEEYEGAIFDIRQHHNYFLDKLAS